MGERTYRSAGSASSTCWVIASELEEGLYFEQGYRHWVGDLAAATVYADPAVAARVAQAIAPRSIFEPFVMTLEEAKRRTSSAAPSDSDPPGTGGEATEPGAPSGVGDLAGAGGPGTLPDEGAVERLAQVLMPGEGDSAGAHLHTQPPESRASGGTPPRPLCEICGRPLPPRSVRYCDGMCRGEAVRQRRFLARRKAGAP